MDIFYNLIRLFSQEPEPTITHTTAPAPTKGGKYDSDIKALEEEFGDMHGRQITIELQKLLIICPRDRKRVEAYQGLRSTLLKEHFCTLNIVSRKTK